MGGISSSVSMAFCRSPVDFISHQWNTEHTGVVWSRAGQILGIILNRCIQHLEQPIDPIRVTLFRHDSTTPPRMGLLASEEELMATQEASIVGNSEVFPGSMMMTMMWDDKDNAYAQNAQTLGNKPQPKHFMNSFILLCSVANRCATGCAEGYVSIRIVVQQMICKRRHVRNDYRITGKPTQHHKTLTLCICPRLLAHLSHSWFGRLTCWWSQTQGRQWFQERIVPQDQRHCVARRWLRSAETSERCSVDLVAGSTERSQCERGFKVDGEAPKTHFW